MARVHSRCGRDGRKLVDALYVMALGTAEQRRDLFGEDVRVTARDRLAAIAVLFDRGWGRPRAAEDFSAGETRREVIIRIPQPLAELEGRTVEFDDGSRRIVRLDDVSRDSREDEREHEDEQ